MEISEITALVTGGASGLGEATARAIVQRGGRVVLADMNEDKGQTVAEELGDAVRFVRTDVTSEGEVTAAIAQASAMGNLRAVVQCAGVGWAQRTVDRDGNPHSLEYFAKVVHINLIGTFNVLRLAAVAMSKNPPLSHGERGVVINTASVAAFDGQIGQIAYSASKAGVAGMTLPAARDLSKVGVRVLTIAPGTFDTPMLALLPEEQRAALAAQIPFPSRLGAPSDYAQLAVHMIENGYLNGETVRIDGALRMPPK